MEENKNNDNVIKQKAKKAAKSAGKKMIKPIRRWIGIALGWLFGVLLVIGFLHLVEFEIKNTLTNILNVFNSGSQSVDESGEESEKGNEEGLIYIDKNDSRGYYKLKSDAVDPNYDYAEEILKRLEELKVNNNVMGFNLENEAEMAEFKNMIDKYIKTEIETSYPELRDGLFDNLLEDVDGKIQINRYMEDRDDPVDLKYMAYSSFINKGDNSVYDYFSIDPDTFELCIAVKPWVTKVEYMDGSVEEETAGRPVIVKLDYKSLVGNYAVPFNFLVTMHLVSQDVDFMNELVELVTQGGLVLSFTDSRTVETTDYTYAATVEEIVASHGSGRSRNLMPDHPNGTRLNSWVETDGAFIPGNLRKQMVMTTYSADLFLTSANTWLKEVEREVAPWGPKQAGNPQVTEETLEIDTQSFGGQTYGIIGQNNKIFTTEYQVSSLTRTVTTGTDVEWHNVPDGEENTKIQDFIRLIKKYPNVESNIKSEPSNIFYLLQQNENTQTHEKLMRYVCYLLNDVDYGITPTQIEYLIGDVSRRHQLSMIRLLRDYVRSWYAPMTTTDEDGNIYYVVEQNGTVGYGLDISAISPETLMENGIESIEAGTLIPQALYNQIEEAQLQHEREVVMDYVEAQGIRLKEYQVNALVSRKWDGEDLTGFITTYNQTWNPDSMSDTTNEQYKADVSEVNYSHRLYTAVMSKGKNPDRRKSEWILFTTGYYTTLDKYDPRGGTILENCVVVMEELLDGTVYYSLTNLPRKIDFENWNGLGCCCCTYVARVAFLSGVKAEDLNRVEEARDGHGPYNMNGCGQLYNILTDLAGWEELESLDEAEPGDIIIDLDLHAYIKADDNMIWDETCGVFFGANAAADSAESAQRETNENGEEYIPRWYAPTRGANSANRGGGKGNWLSDETGRVALRQPKSDKKVSSNEEM